MQFVVKEFVVAHFGLCNGRPHYRKVGGKLKEE